MCIRDRSLIPNEEESVGSCPERNIGFRLDVVLQAQEYLKEPWGGGGLLSDADVSPIELLDGLGAVQEDASRFLRTGDAKTRHRLKAVLQAETVHHGDRACVDLAVFSSSG